MELHIYRDARFAENVAQEKKLTRFPAHLFLLPQTKQWNGSRLVNFKVEPGNKNSQLLELQKSGTLGVPLSPPLLPFHKDHHLCLVTISWTFLVFKCDPPTSLQTQNPSHTPSSLHSLAGVGLSKVGLVRKKLFFHCELKLFLHYEFELFHCELSPALTQLTAAQQRPAELGWHFRQELFNPHSLTPLPLYKPVNDFNPYFPPIP